MSLSLHPTDTLYRFQQHQDQLVASVSSL